MTVMAPRPRVKPAPTGVVVAQAGVTAVARPNAIAVHPTAVLFRCPFISPYLLISLAPVCNATRSVSLLWSPDGGCVMDETANDSSRSAMPSKPVGRLSESCARYGQRSPPTQPTGRSHLAD